MGSTPLEGCIGFFFLKNLFWNFCLHIKDSKWGRKCIFMNFESCNGSPKQIPLWQLPLANEAKTCHRCRAFWAWFGLVDPWVEFSNRAPECKLALKLCKLHGLQCFTYHNPWNLFYRETICKWIFRYTTLLVLIWFLFRFFIQHYVKYMKMKSWQNYKRFKMEQKTLIFY